MMIQIHFKITLSSHIFRCIHTYIYIYRARGKFHWPHRWNLSSKHGVHRRWCSSTLCRHITCRKPSFTTKGTQRSWRALRRDSSCGRTKNTRSQSGFSGNKPIFQCTVYKSHERKRQENCKYLILNSKCENNYLSILF